MVASLQMLAHRPAQTGPDPTPVPLSSVRPLSSAKEAFALALNAVALDAIDEAQELYGDDELLELEAIAAGAHPKQRGLDEAALDNSRRRACEALAQIRSKQRT